MFKEIPIEQKSDKRGMTRSKVRGVGINDAPYLTSYKINGTVYTCPYILRWRTMLERSYSKSWHKRNPTYIGSSVCNEWHSFMAFKAWMTTQDWVGKQLDKDLLSLGKKTYSPETCLFVSPGINSLFLEKDNAQGHLPLGIYARNGKYEVGVSLGNSKRTWVGSYKTVPEAIDAYLSAKEKAVAIAISKESNPRVIQAVKNYYKYFADKLCALKAAY